MLLTETDGYTKEETEYQMRKIVEVFQANHPREIKQARSDKEAEELWLARKSAYAVLARIKTHFILEDITVPMARVAEMLKGIDAIAAKHQLQIATFGHAGDGNLHPQILYDGYNPREVERVEAASAELFKLAIDLDGTLVQTEKLKALSYAKAAVQLCPHRLDEENVDAALNLGGACILSKKFAQAVAILEPLSEREPHNPMVWTKTDAPLA